MATTISIDIGGTFTDCFILKDNQMVIGKSDTTPGDVSVCFMKALDAAREGLEVSLEDLVKDTELVSYSTTIPVNALIQRIGPRLGLITTAGFEDFVAIGRGRAYGDGLPLAETALMTKTEKPEPLIPREMILGVNERIDWKGDVVLPLDKDEVLEKVQQLVDRGAQGFVVCLLSSYVNPTHEQQVKEIIEEEFPDQYLGSVPVLLSNETWPVHEEYLRCNVATLNAYMHTELADQLHRIGNELRRLGYKKPILIIKNIGGMGSITRTTAIDVYGSGPVSGLFGSATIGELYGIKNIIGTDMGGTSFDYGMVIGGETSFYHAFPTIERFRVSLPLIAVRSIGAGGGSIAFVNRMGRLQVGPKSAGAVPGPVCYDLGGTEPTVTDADLVLGYINPDFFAGGKRKLNKEKAEKAIKEKVADPLGMKVEEAALGVKEIVDAYMGQEINKDLSLQGYDPRDFVVLAYGGAGVTHCCGYSEYIGAQKIITLPFSPVFCAFGGCNMDVFHSYELTNPLHLLRPRAEAYLSDYDLFNNVVRNLQEKALADMRWEGITPEEIEYSLELEMRYGTQYTTTRVTSPHLFIRNEEDVKAICSRFRELYTDLYGTDAAFPESGIEVSLFRLKTLKEQPRVTFTAHPLEGEDSEPALKGSRNAYWKGGWQETKVYDYDRLKCGNVVHGPAIVEYGVTTYVIPEGKKLSIDTYLHAIIENE